MAVVVGCGSAGAADKLVKDQLAIIEQMASVFEEVKDKQSFTDAMTRVSKLMEQNAKLEEELKALGQERKDAAIQANAVQYDQAWARFTKAKEKANKAFR